MNDNISRRKKFTNYLIAFLSIMAVSPFYNFYLGDYLLIFMIILFLIGLNRGVKLFDRKILGVLVFVYALILIQGIIYGGFSLAAIYLPLIIFYLPYLIYSNVGISFFKYFVNVLFFIAIYTTPLWLAQSLIPSFDSLLRDLIDEAYALELSSTPRSLLFFTPAWSDGLFSEKYGLYRNSGLFHEPGAYGVFLNIGILMNTFFTGKLFDRKNIFFIFCLLTTFSTAGYITFFALFAIFLIKANFNLVLKFVVIIAFLFISYKTYQEEEFLQSKVQTQYEDQYSAARYELGKTSAQSGRFFAFYTSLYLFLENPLTGRGIIYATSEKASGEMDQDSSYSYGFIGMLATYGIFFGLYYMVNIYKGLKRIGTISNQSKLNVIGGFVAINLALLTQIFVLSTVVVTIFMAGIYYNKHNDKPRKNQIKIPA